jgi:twinfilin-like protein
VKTHPLSDSLEKDFGSLAGEFEPKIPCYIIFRTDTTNMNGYEWLLLSYVPDGSLVRERMLYASSRDTLKRQLGSNYFGGDIQGSSKEEFAYAGYVDLKKKKEGHTEVALTHTEIQTRQEKSAEIAQGTSKEYVHSVNFPMSTAAQDKLKSFKDGQLNLVQLRVDPDKETIELDCSSSGDLSSIVAKIPHNEPRFNMIRFSHEHEGQHYDSFVFVYSCTNNSPVKLKMLYSTVKAVANSTAEQIGIKFDKKLEISEAGELTEDLLMESLHPPSEEKKQNFSKPSRAGKGAPRLIRK